MALIARYLSHPQVTIDPASEVMSWSLSETGQARVSALVDSLALAGTTRVISSAETKAIETAAPLAGKLNCQLEIRELMHENDRSSTGFLPPQEFESVADQFFASPAASVRGWETALHAQQRIVSEVEKCLENPATGDVLFVGHGGVGTLLLCHLLGVPISRELDQGAGGGGNCFAFSLESRRVLHHWQPMERLIQGQTSTV